CAITLSPTSSSCVTRLAPRSLLPEGSTARRHLGGPAFTVKFCKTAFIRQRWWQLSVTDHNLTNDTLGDTFHCMRNLARKSSTVHVAPRRFSLAFSAVTVLLFGPLCLRAQEPTIAVDVRVVNVLATVRDKHGQIINNLSQDDFILQEEGK